MELIQDWKTFQSVFYPGRRNSLLQATSASAPITVITAPMSGKSVEGAPEQEMVVGAFAEGMDLTSWVGQPLSQVSDQVRHRELVKVSLQDVDQVIREALPLPHFFQQVEFIQTEMGRRHNAKRAKGAPTLKRSREHFMIEAFRGWWSKISPSAFGIFIQLEKQRTGTSKAAKPNEVTAATSTQIDEQFLMVFRRGAIDVFYSPDLSALPADRRRNPNEIVKVLSDKHLVPVQGLTASHEDWELWARSPNPWSLAAAAIRKDRARLVPFRWRIAFLIATRAFIGL